MTLMVRDAHNGHRLKDLPAKSEGEQQTGRICAGTLEASKLTSPSVKKNTKSPGNLRGLTFARFLHCSCMQLIRSASEGHKAMSGQFPIFDVALKKRGRKWSWAVSPTDGAPLMLGSESSRPAARYRANRALFQLLLTSPYRSQLSAQSGQEARVRR